MLDGLLDRVRAGETASAVLRGAAGVGKSALLDYVSQSASDCTILRASGNSFETSIPYAGLHQLCAPLEHRIGSLSDAQAEALAVAFGVRGGDPEPLMLGAALVAVLSDHPSGRPLVCLVDNAEYLDSASARSLAFVARHSRSARLALIFASQAFDGDELMGLDELVVTGLREPDARSLLVEAMCGPLDKAVLHRVSTEANGNPAHILRMARAVHPVDVAGGFGFGPPLPPAARAEPDVLRRLRALPPDTLELLLTAALEPTGEAAIVWRAAERAGIGPAAAVPAISGGLVEFGSRIRFSHHLARSAVYQMSTLEDIQRIHDALAQETDPVRDPARRVWHRALAITGPDESMASELVRYAGHALQRGGLPAKASFLERAAALTLNPERRAGLMLEAAEAKHQAGSPPAAAHLLEMALHGPLDPVRFAHATRVRGSIALALGRITDARDDFLSAAKQFESEDPRLAIDSYTDAVSAVVLAGNTARTAGVVEVAEAVLSSSVTQGAGDATNLLVVGAATCLTKGLDHGAPILQRAIRPHRTEDSAPGPDASWLSLASHCARSLWDDVAWETISGRLVANARDAGALTALPRALDERTVVYLYRGDLQGASLLIEEADRVSDAIGSCVPRYGRLLHDAWRGRPSGTADLIESTKEDGGYCEEGAGRSAVNLGAAVLYNGSGRYCEALRAAQLAVNESMPLDFSGLALPELVEAASRCGHTNLAMPALARLSEIARSVGTDWAIGVEARSRALVSAGGTAEELYAKSIDHLGRSHLRMDLARSHLLYGEWLRRAGRRLDARAQLRTALAHFDDMGCEAFAERTRRELVATGEKVRKRSFETRNDLTAQEIQIARLACAGRTNPEIGAELFISPRTVEWHLRKVYPKLGIASRRDLRLLDIG